MAKTVHVTGAVDPALLQRAKVVAAKAQTSINALFNAELRYLVETFEAGEPRSPSVVQTDRLPDPSVAIKT